MHLHELGDCRKSNKTALFCGKATSNLKTLELVVQLLQADTLQLTLYCCLILFMLARWYICPELVSYYLPSFGLLKKLSQDVRQFSCLGSIPQFQFAHLNLRDCIWFCSSNFVTRMLPFSSAPILYVSTLSARLYLTLLPGTGVN